MGVIWHDYEGLRPDDLTAIIRYILLDEDRDPNLASLDPWFPDEVIYGQKVKWRESLDKPYTTSVPFRSLSTAMPQGKRPGRTRKEAGALPLGIAYEFTEFDELLLEAYERGIPPEELFIPEIYADVQRGMRGAMNRAQILKGKLIVDAGFTVAENGVNQTLASQRDDGNQLVPAGTAWSDANQATATPHADERAGVRYMQTTWGIPWNRLVVLTHGDTYEQYRKMQSVLDDFQSFRALSALGDEQINVMRSQINLPPVRVIDRQIEDPNGTMVDLIEKNAWVLTVADQPLGKTVWGTPQAAGLSTLRLVNQTARGPIAYVEEESNPPARNVIVDAIGLPVIQAPNWTYHIQTNAGL